MKYDVTVGIVNYNNYAQTREAIRSIQEQTTGVKFKIYVADNASADDSAERIANDFPHIALVFSDRNLGFGAANNVILRMADSKYHAIVNPDILLRDNALLRLYEYMEANPDVGLASPAVFYPGGGEQCLPKRDPKLKYLIANRLPLKRLEGLRKRYAMEDEDLSRERDIEFATGCFMFARTALLKEVGGFDERYFMYMEDADLSRTVRQRARVTYVPSVRVYHDYQRTSAKKLRFLFIHTVSMFKYFFKWRGNDK